MRSRIIVNVLSFIMLFGMFSANKLSAQNSLMISDGTQFVAQSFYPKFSWNTTPMYYMFWGQELLTPEELEFIADKTDFLCIEKVHGRSQLGAAELGAKHEAAAFRKIKPDMKVLFYFNSAWAWPFTSYTENFTLEKINDYPELKSYLLINPETGELNRRGNTLSFDVLNPEFRTWWVETVVKGVEVSNCDGVFIDQMHGFYELRKDRREEVHKAQGALMADLKKKLGPDKILLGNNAHQEIAKYVFPVIDANMFEHYNSTQYSKEALLQDWKDMLRIAKAGKISVYRIGVSDDKSRVLTDNDGNPLSDYDRRSQISKEKLEYYLAVYLIGAQPYSYLQYGWGFRLNTGALVDYPELQRPLGAPKGAYTRLSPDTWEFSREFEHASVWVDTEKKKAKITWKK